MRENICQRWIKKYSNKKFGKLTFESESAFLAVYLKNKVATLKEKFGENSIQVYISFYTPLTDEKRHF